MKKLMSILLVIFTLAICQSAFAMGRNPKCNKDFYPGSGSNSRLMWVNVTRGVMPMSNAQAIPMWENTIRVQRASSRDYSASIALLTAAISEAQDNIGGQAKNPYFNPSKPEDKPDLFWNCENGK